MSIFFVNTQDAQISNAFLATLGAAPGSTYLAQVKTFGLVPSVQAMINATGSSTAAALSTKVATNLGLTGAALTGGTAYLSSVTFAGSSSAWAAKLMETLNLFSNLQSDATYGSAATAYLARVNSAVSYSSVATNNSTDLSTLAAAVGSAGSTGAGSTFTLTAGTDLAGTSSASNAGIASTFKFTGGNELVDGMTATIQTGDVLVDSSTTDNDVFNIVSTGAMAAMTAVNLETVNLTLASGSPTGVFTSFSGLKTINVLGNVAGTVTDAEAAKINVSNYTRVLTVNETLIDGTAAAGNADVTNITVSGLSFGSTAATRSGITLIAGTAGVLETLNITSSGAAANDFALDASTGVTLGTVNFLGAANVTARVEHADITGLTINGAGNTANTTLRIDRNGITTAATNLSGVNGIDTLSFADSTVGTDSLVAIGVENGASIEAVTSFTANTNSIGVRGSANSTTDVLSLTLDHATASTRLQLGTVDIQDVETLNVISKGHSTALLAAGNEISLTGDMTSIVMTGDTAIALVANIDAPATGSRTTVINASAVTAAVSINTSSDTNTTNLYTITGSAFNDTLVGGAGVNNISGGDGNDTITGGAGNDVISTGAGTDTVIATNGLDTVTLGAGVDTIVFGVAPVAGVRQVSTLTPTGFDGGLIQVVVNGVPFQVAFTTDIATSIDNFLTANAATILANHGVTVTDGTTAIVLTGAATGAAFTISFNFGDGGIQTVGTVTATTAAVAQVAMVQTISGFTTATGGDVISFDISDINGVAGIDNLRDSTDNVAGGDAVVITDYVGTALTMAAGANVIKVGFANTINSAANVLTLIDAGNITTANAISIANGGDAIVMVLYDADDGVMRAGLLSTTDNAAALDDNLIFEEIAVVGMTSTQYTALSAANFSFVA